MRKSLIAIIVLAMLSLSGTAFAKPMHGLTAIPSFSGLGLGYRCWQTPVWGYGVQVMPSWEFNDVTATARLMYGFHTGETSRWYGVLAAGYMAVNEEYDMSDYGLGGDMEYSLSMPTFALGIGWEKLFGFKKNKGLSFELGYQMGSADYELEYDSYTLYGITIPGGTIEDTFEVSPIYIGASFAYYFNM